MPDDVDSLNVSQAVKDYVKMTDPTSAAQDTSVSDYIKQNIVSQMSPDDQKAYAAYYQGYFDNISAPYVNKIADRIQEIQDVENQAAKYEKAQNPNRTAQDLSRNNQFVSMIEDEQKQVQTMGKDNQAALYAYDKVLEDKGEAQEEDAQNNDITQNAMMAEVMQQLSNAAKLDLVRGAMLKCMYGSHTRMLNLPMDHGVYIRGIPQAHAKDAVPGGPGDTDYNIGWFGMCSSPTPPPGGEQTQLTNYTPVNLAGQYLMKPVDGTCSGPMCKPSFDTPFWQQTDPYSSLTQEKIEIATTKSYIMCKYGGYIYPQTSGQLQIQVYIPPYAACPFPPNTTTGSDFMQWCADQGVCPYTPGTSDYNAWYKDKISGLKSAGTTDDFSGTVGAVGAALNGDVFQAEQAWESKKNGDACDEAYKNWLDGLTETNVLTDQTPQPELNGYNDVHDAYYAGADNPPSLQEDIKTSIAQFGALPDSNKQ